MDSDDDDDLEAIESLEAPPSAAQRVTYVRDFLDGEFKTYDDMENALRSLPQVIRHQVWSLSQFMSLDFALQISRGPTNVGKSIVSDIFRTFKYSVI